MNLPSPPVKWSHLNFFKNKWPQLGSKLLQKSKAWVPQPQLMFSALDMVPPSSVRVVIFGQDPYPDTRHATGLAFSAPPQTTSPPPSLKVIFEELRADLGVAKNSCDLSGWAKQGVLLLNVYLTTEVGKRGAHKSLGWRALAKDVVSEIDNGHPVVFVLWGENALGLDKKIKYKQKHMIIKSSHPSPLGKSKYCRGNPPFLGSRPFSRINNWLSSTPWGPIDWSK